jgi:hypothetical protein
MDKWLPIVLVSPDVLVLWCPGALVLAMLLRASVLCATRRGGECFVAARPLLAMLAVPCAVSILLPCVGRAHGPFPSKRHSPTPVYAQKSIIAIASTLI